MPDAVFVSLSGFTEHPLFGCQTLLVCSWKYSKNLWRGKVCVCVCAGGSSAQRCGERREWVAESILILWIRPRFLPNEMTFISVNPIWVAKIFISILIDITAAANEARQDGKIYSGGACDVCVHRAWLFPSSPASVTVSFINVVTSLRPPTPTPPHPPLDSFIWQRSQASAHSVLKVNRLKWRISTWAFLIKCKFWVKTFRGRRVETLSQRPRRPRERVFSSGSQYCCWWRLLNPTSISSDWLLGPTCWHRSCQF